MSLNLKPQVIFYKASATEFYIITNDRKNNLDSVNITKKRICNTSSVGTDVALSYALMAPYINDLWDTIYASPYIPTYDLSPNNWDKQNPVKTFINDSFYAVYCMLNIERRQTPKYIFSGYNFYLSVIDISKFSIDFSNRMYHKTKFRRAVYKNKEEAYSLSKHWPIEAYKFLLNDKITFRWINRDIQNEIEWASIKHQKVLKAIITTTAWAHIKDLTEIYKQDDQGKTTFGFSAQGRYWYMQHLLPELLEEFKVNPSDELECYITDIQQILLERLVLAKHRQKLTPIIINWHKQYMPSEPIYLPRLNMLSPKLEELL